MIAFFELIVDWYKSYIQLNEFEENGRLKAQTGAIHLHRVHIRLRADTETLCARNTCVRVQPDLVGGLSLPAEYAVGEKKPHELTRHTPNIQSHHTRHRRYLKTEMAVEVER